jgi:hypothetical protein
MVGGKASKPERFGAFSRPEAGPAQRSFVLTARFRRGEHAVWPNG